MAPKLAPAKLKPRPAPAKAGSPGTTTPVAAVGETVTEVPVEAAAADTTSPGVTLSGIPEEPVTESVLSFAGRAVDADGVVASLAYSLDGGITWHPVGSVAGLGTSTARFAVSTFPLEDGTYTILARARDASGHEGRSASAEVTVDQLPPVLGGVVLSYAGRDLEPTGDALPMIAGSALTLTVSLTGGVTEAAVLVDDVPQPLAPDARQRLWSADLRFSRTGRQVLTLRARDGAGHALDVPLPPLEVRSPLLIRDAGGKPVGASVQAERFDDALARWIRAGEVSAPEGHAPLYLSSGRWRLVVEQSSGRRVRTEAVEVPRPGFVSGTVTFPALRASFLSVLRAVPVRAISTSGERASSARAETVRLQVTDAAGRPHGLDAWRGRLVLLSLLGVWNRTSVDQLAVLATLTTRGGNQLVVAPILVQQSPAELATLLARGRYPFDSFVDETGQETALLGGVHLPRHLLLDRRGVLRVSVDGFLPLDEAERLVRAVGAAPADTGPASQPVAASLAEWSPTVEVRNGTTVEGLAAREGRILEQRGFRVSAPRNATRADVATTRVVDATGGKRPSGLDVLRTRYGVASIGALPPSEDPATTDFVIILGADRPLGRTP